MTRGDYARAIIKLLSEFDLRELRLIFEFARCFK